MGPLSTRARDVVADARRNFCEFAIQLTNEVFDEERNRKACEERFNSLRKTEDILQQREGELNIETQLLSTEEEELEARLNDLRNKLNAATIESTGFKEKKKKLFEDVALLELEKNQKVEEFKRRFESYSKYWNCYKTVLGIEIKLDGPDVFIVGFPEGESLTLRSVDMESWEILSVNDDFNLKEELTYYLRQTGDIIGVVCRARNATLHQCTSLWQ